MASGSERHSGPHSAGTEFSAVAAFTAAWGSGAGADPPSIADFLPDASTLRRDALLELIRVDMRHRWLRRTAPHLPPGSLRKRLTEYCAEFSELDARDLPPGLVYEEFVIRRHSGERVDPRECLREYPDQAAELRELLIADDVDQSTRAPGLLETATRDTPEPPADLGESTRVGPAPKRFTGAGLGDAARPGIDDGEATQLGPGPDDEGEPTRLGPTPDDDGEATQLGPGPQDEGEPTQLGPGPQDEGEPTRLGSPPGDDGEATQLGPGLDDEGEPTRLGPTPDDDGEATQLGPGPQDEGEPTQLGPRPQDEGEPTSRGLPPGEQTRAGNESGDPIPIGELFGDATRGGRDPLGEPTRAEDFFGELTRGGARPAASARTGAPEEATQAGGPGEPTRARSLDESTRLRALDEATRAGSGPDESTRAGSGPGDATRAGDAPGDDATRAEDPPAEDSTRIPDSAEVLAETRATGGLAAPAMSDLLDRIEIGQSIDDFDLLTGLGSGAFARVFLARQRSLQRLVAVKISADHGTEPQTLAQLDHDYIVRVFDQRLISGIRFESGRRLRLLYMQFLPGGTLLGVLRWVRATPVAERSGQLLLDAVDAAMEEKGEIRPTDSSVRAEIASLSWPEAVAWLGRRLAEALDYADGHGVLHRDVKPANILLTAEAVPKLADFNISFARNLEDASPVSYFGGSLSYMSPEQLEACHPGHAHTAADLDTRADIFSLGVVLWELLTGAKPFDDSTAGPGDHGDRTTLEAMLARRRGGVEGPALDRIPQDCPAALRRVLLTCLAPDREQRWRSGAVLAEQFALCLDPRARDLVDPPPNSWRMRLRPWLVPLVTLAVAIPNILVSVYNILHNDTLIVSRLSAEAERSFTLTTATVNSLFYPIGIAIIIYLCRLVISVPRGLRKGREYDAETLRRARTDVLLCGERISFVVFSLWVLAGITFPIALRLATGEIPARGMVHFLVSLVVCGAMAVAYPFFLVTFYLVRCIYPMFLREGVSADDVALLHRLGRRCTSYLAVAASVPLLAVAGVTFLPPDDIPLVIVAVRVLSVGGIAAFVVVYIMFRALEADLRALERVGTPVRSHDSRERAGSRS